MRNAIQHYAWGSTTDIPRLTGIPNPDEKPMAELWMGDHPRLPSHLRAGTSGKGGPGDGASRAGGREQELGAFLESYPRFALGEAVRERFGSRLPFLFKLLSAAKGLSIQVHPSRSQAAEGYEREEAAGIPLDAPNRNYKDRNHKPEVLLAVTPFWALSGFRDPEEIAEDFRRIEGPGELVSRLEEGDLESFYRALMAPDTDGGSGGKGILRRVLEYARCKVGDGGRTPGPGAPVPGPDCRFSWALELNRQFPDDLGALAPLYLHCLYLVPGEALFLESGLLHAYLKGTGIELMANSDNVLRGGCTVKHVDLPELLRIVRFEATESPRFPGVRKELPGAVVTTFAPPVEEFALQKLEISGGYSFEKGNSPAILFGLGGELSCRGTADIPAGQPSEFPGEESIALSSGESIFIPAAVGTLTLSGSGEAYLASV